MNRARGFTFIELIITIALTALVVGAITVMFGFVSVRLSDTYSKSMLYDQANDVANRIEQTVRNAHTCSTRDGGATLLCQMPLKGVDTDEDGHRDSYYPDSVDSAGNGVYSGGRYVWFFSAGLTGNYGSGSGYFWRAERGQPAPPGVANVDTAFAYYYGTKLRFPLVTSGTFSVDSSAKTVTFTLNGSTKIGADTSNGAVNDETSRFVALTRTVGWRN